MIQRFALSGLSLVTEILSFSPSRLGQAVFICSALLLLDGTVFPIFGRTVLSSTDKSEQDPIASIPCRSFPSMTSQDAEHRRTGSRAL